MNFFLSPIYALFNVRFYRSLLSVSMFRGILYVLYLSAITAIVWTVPATAWVAARLVPGGVGGHAGPVPRNGGS